MPQKASLVLFILRHAWLHVKETPDPKRIIVFKRGIWKGLKASTPFGGHKIPSSVSGASIPWKKHQKNLKKNKISLKINNKIPFWRPLSTLFVWRPMWVLSRVISRHHCVLIIVKINTLKKNNIIVVKFIDKINPLVRSSAPKDLAKGHGLMWTMWNGWNVIVNFS